MKKLIFLIALAGVLAPGLSDAAIKVCNVSSSVTVIRQTVETQHKVHKTRRRVKRHVVRSARVQKQLRQGQKHQAEEQRVEKAQQKLKKDTARKRP